MAAFHRKDDFQTFFLVENQIWGLVKKTFPTLKISDDISSFEVSNPAPIVYLAVKMIGILLA